MNVTQVPFGEVQGRSVDLFTLDNANGLTVKITNYGGTVTSITVPDRVGNSGEIACGFDALAGYFSDAYKANSPYFGCVVGRYAGRVKDGQFTLAGRQYQLATNDGPNHLHGGLIGFDKCVWDAEPIREPDACGVRLTLTSADGDEGYPGRVSVSVEYRVTPTNELAIRYIANSDRATPLSLTNHTYFNLNGFADKVLDHQVEIQSDRYLVPDSTNVPVGEQQKVAGSACDFRTAKTLGDAFADLPNGFEHYYVFDNPAGVLRKVAEFQHEGTGRSLEVSTTEPGMLFYTGYYTSDDLAREDGAAYGQFKAFCCEVSKYPNGPNIDGAPRSILLPDRLYDESTVFKFGW